jgi:hypothetical protein
MNQVPIVERAFQVARSGTCASIQDVRVALRAEGYGAVDQHITGSLGKQLKAICQSHAAPEPAGA